MTRARIAVPVLLSCLPMLAACSGSAHDTPNGPLDAAISDVPSADSGVDGALVEDGSFSDVALDARPVVCDGPGARYVTRVVSYHFGEGQSLGQDKFPANILGPPHGAGCCQGSLDTVSLGNGGTVTVAFGDNAIVDGPGPDFIVFENAFESSGGGVFAELATVEVSADGQNWVSYPCTAVQPPYGTCAGYHPVYANPDTNDINPLDPTVAGGDAFDLAELRVPLARYVRITDRADLATGLASVFDLDAVAIVNAQCP